MRDRLPAHADTEMESKTSVVPRSRSAQEPYATAGSSSDPPTKFLRIEQHIELPTGSLVDDFEVVSRLGAGAMGVVYCARHVKLDRQVALKVIAPSMGADPQALARFGREAKALASLKHPNIVDVYAFGTLPDGRSYFAMEFLSGTTLDERLTHSRIPFADGLDVIDQMARGLEAAHAQGIVHRDLKPSNTFLQHLRGEQRPIVKLLDWGLVRILDADDAERTSSDAVIGTALYLSPEQARSPNVDGRTDIYALGVVAYEVVLGQHPFPHARTATAALAAHLTESPPLPRAIWREIPAVLDGLLHSMLAKDPSCRPTLAQVRSVIASLRSSTTAAGHPRGASVQAERNSLASLASPVHAPASSVPVAEPRASRGVFLAVAGLVGLGAVVAAAVASSGPTTVSGDPSRIVEPRRAAEVDASAEPVGSAAATALDASAPSAVPTTLPDAPDATSVTPGSGVDRAAPPNVGRRAGREADPPARARSSKPEPESAELATPAAGASVDPEDDAASTGATARSASPPATTPPAQRAQPASPTKKAPNRDVIIDPFRKKKATK